MLKEFIMFLKGDYLELILNGVSYLDFYEMLDDNFRWQIEFSLDGKETVEISLEHEKVVYHLSLELKDDLIIFKKAGADD